MPLFIWIKKRYNKKALEEVNMKFEVGQNITIQSYKHDGTLHRTWLTSKVLAVHSDHFVVANNRTWVVEADGRRWFTREPAICFFYTNRWYNVIAMVRKTGIYYYCNIASPSLYDGEAIKNIDYDLDVKVFPDGNELILDEDEYIDHSVLMEYSEELKEVIELGMEEILEVIHNGEYPFKEDVIQTYLEQYISLNHQK